MSSREQGECLNFKYVRIFRWLDVLESGSDSDESSFSGGSSESSEVEKRDRPRVVRKQIKKRQ